MKESIGNVWLFSIVLVFILIFAAYLTVTLNYSKAFKLKNEVLTIIEKKKGISDKTDFGTSLIEAVKCGGIVIAKVPNNIETWMKDGDELTKAILWFNGIDEISDLLPSVIHSWISDLVPEEVYENQKTLMPLFTEDVQTLEIIECYEKNIINNLNSYNYIINICNANKNLWCNSYLTSRCCISFKRKTQCAKICINR